jgi:nitroreductase
METINCLLTRRSVRDFSSRPISQADLEEIMNAANWAPSAKNRQPWEFVILEGKTKEHIAHLMDQGADRFEQRGLFIGSVRISATVVRQVPVLVVISNASPMSGGISNIISTVLTTGGDTEETWNRIIPFVDEVLSIGAAFQNMCLAAHALGIGSLWIGDIFIAWKDVCAVLGIKGDLMGAVSLGYANTTPPARPRRPWKELTTRIS